MEFASWEEVLSNTGDMFPSVQEIIKQFTDPQFVQTTEPIVVTMSGTIGFVAGGGKRPMHYAARGARQRVP